MDEFVASHSDAEVMENGKIRCTLTGHEVTPQLATVQAYWTGKKYRNAKARREYDYSQHEPYLVPHTKSEHLLYCTLTKQPVSRQQRAVEGHLNGKKFKRLKEAALAPPAAASSGAAGAGGEDEEDEEDLEDDDDAELHEAGEIQAFLSQGTTEFMDDGEEGAEGAEGGGASAERGAARGGPSALKKEAKRARIAERRARSVPSEMDDGQQQDEEEEAFWVRGAGDEVPRAARGAEPVAPVAPVEPVAPVAGGGKPKPKPKPKKKMARIG